jgi:Mg-chelatase subunit ChlD
MRSDFIRCFVLLLAAVFICSCAAPGAKPTSYETTEEGDAADEVVAMTDSGKRPAEHSPRHKKEELEEEKTFAEPPPPPKDKDKKDTYHFEDDGVEGDLVKPGGEMKEPPLKHKPRGRRIRPASAGVKAGSADDNMQFHAFLEFLDENGRLGLECNVTERIIVSVKDKAGLPLADALVTVWDGKEKLLERRTYADGRTMIFPSESKALQGQSVKVVVRYGTKEKESFLNASRKHRLNFKFGFKRSEFQQVPLDVAFVLDTTGSMGDELQRLKKTLEYIHFQINHLAPKPDVRFGIVLFRDTTDDYRTQVIAFTSDVEQFARDLDKVRAGGGGDNPEDVQEGLKDAMTKLKWRKKGAKLAFLIGDAPPHLDYGQKFTYVSAMREAAKKGIKIASIGASGLDTQGELVWRQIAQYTMAPFVFLTYGESGDSEGSPSSVSHHVGSNWVAENLDAIIIRMVKVELAHYSPKGAQPKEDFFVAAHNPKVASDDVLEDLFRQSVKQLVDYCVLRIEPRTPTVVLPIKYKGKKLKVPSQKLENRLALSLVQSGKFQLVEKKDLPDLIKTLSDQYSLKYDGDKVAEMGKLIPAKLAVFTHVGGGGKEKVEVMIKLVRLETGEILSLSLLKIEEKLLAAR